MVNDKTSSTIHIPSLDAYFEQTLKDKQKLSFNVVATIVDQKTERLYEETKEMVSFGLSSKTTSDAWSVIGEGIYENELEKGKISAGLKHFQKWTDNDYLTDALVNSSMQQSESYLYTDYTGRLKRLNYSIGIGGKRSWFEQKNGEGYTHYNFQPTISLNYIINDRASFRYRLNIYNNIPLLAELTNAEVAIDSLQVRRGNPSLKPDMSYNNTIVFDYSFKKLYLSLYGTHWYSTNFVRGTTLLENNHIVRTYQNAGKFHRIYAELYGRLSLLNNKLILSANLGVNRFTTMDNVYNVLNYVLYASYLYQGWMFYAQTYDMGAGFTGEIKRIRGIGNSIGFQYQKNHYTLGAGIRNVFIHSKTITENISHIAPYISTQLANDMNNFVFLKFAVKFEYVRKFNTGRQRISNSDTGSSTLEMGK
jgi:hypothetical protein